MHPSSWTSKYWTLSIVSSGPSDGQYWPLMASSGTSGTARLADRGRRYSSIWMLWPFETFASHQILLDDFHIHTKGRKHWYV